MAIQVAIYLQLSRVLSQLVRGGEMYAVIKHDNKELLFVICPKCGYYTHLNKDKRNLASQVINLEQCKDCGMYFRVK